MNNLKKYAPYLVFFAAMLWATDAPFRVHLTKELSSNFIVLGEHFVAILFCLPILFKGFSELKKLTWKEWGATLFIAIGGSALASIAFTQSFHYVNPSVAILLQKLQPFLVIGLAASLLKESFTKRFWLFATVAVLGAYLISFPNIIPQTYAGEAWNVNALGVGLALLAAIFWGASTVFGKMVLQKTSFKMMTALRFSFAFVFLLILNLAQGTIPALQSVSATDYLYIVIIGMTSGVVSLFIYYKGLEHTRAGVATIAELGFPLAAVLVNWVFLGATLAPMQLVGTAILLAGVYGLARYNRNATEVSV